MAAVGSWRYYIDGIMAVLNRCPGLDTADPAQGSVLLAGDPAEKFPAAIIWPGRREPDKTWFNAGMQRYNYDIDVWVLYERQPNTFAVVWSIVDEEYVIRTTFNQHFAAASPAAGPQIDTAMAMQEGHVQLVPYFDEDHLALVTRVTGHCTEFGTLNEGPGLLS